MLDLWRPTTENTKTDSIPTQYIGDSREASLDTCKRAKCLLLNTKNHPILVEYSLERALAQADEAISKGWRASVLAPHDHTVNVKTPDGNRAVVCPALVHDHVTCNSCGMCDVERNPGVIIMFPDHGSTAGGARGRAPVCYSQFGTPALGFSGGMVPRAKRVPEEYTLEYALTNRLRRAKYVRFGAIGNLWPAIPKRKIVSDVEKVRAEGLGVLMYDHRAWKVKPGQWMKDYAMASCDGLKRKRS